MSLTTEIRVKLTAVQIGSNDFGGPRFEPTIDKLYQFAFGTGANQADILWADERTVALSSSETLDFAVGGGLTDALGVAVAAVELVALLVTADAGNTNNVVVGDATAPILIFGGTTPTISIKPGGAFLVIAPGASGHCPITAATADGLKIANSGAGTGVTYRVEVLGRTT